MCPVFSCSTGNSHGGARLVRGMPPPRLPRQRLEELRRHPRRSLSRSERLSRASSCISKPTTQISNSLYYAPLRMLRDDVLPRCIPSVSPQPL